MAIIGLSVYFLILIYVTALKPKYISAQKLYFFKCLFPSWRFYEDVCYLPELFYRTSVDGVEYTEWMPGINKLERNWINIFINPQANLNHALNTLFLQLENDKEEFEIADKDKLTKTVSYELVRNYIEYILKDQKVRYYQFKLRSYMQGNENDYQDTVISPICEAGVY